MTVLQHFLSKNTYRAMSRAQRPRNAVMTQFQRWASTRKQHADGTLVIEHLPSPSAPRNAPVPIVCVGSSELEGDRGAFLSQRLGGRLSAQMASRGFMSYQFDLPLKRQANDTAKGVMDRLASSLHSLIRSTDVPFPPILYAEQLGCLIAQTYVSSYPLYGLILDSPPRSCASLSSWPGLADRLPLPLSEFTFEPRFPVLVLERQSAGGLLKNSRLVKEGADYMEICENAACVESRDVPDRSLAVEQWIDELGC